MPRRRSLLQRIKDFAKPSSTRNEISVEGEAFPWFQHGHVYPPESVKEVHHSPDDPVKKRLELEYLYGWTGKGCFGDILLENCEGELVYPAAAVGVVLNPRDNSQRVHFGHSDNCICIDAHPSEKVAASGQVGPKGVAKVMVWDTETMENYCDWAPMPDSLPPGGIIDLSFCPSGERLAVMAGNQYQAILFIYDWKKNKVIRTGPSMRGKVFMIRFVDENTVVVASAQGIKFVDLDNSHGAPRFRNTIVFKKGKLQTAYSITCKGDQYVCGMRDGSLYVFHSNRLVEAKEKTHEGSVWSLCCDDNKVVSGGRDGKLNIWKYGEDGTLSSIELEKTFELGGSVRSVTTSHKDENIVFAMLTNGEMVQVDITADEEESKTVVMHSHYGDTELWGLDSPANAESPLFISAGEDGCVRVWDKEKHKCVKSRHFEELRFKSVGIKEGEEIALGTSEGDLIILNWDDLETKHEALISEQEVGVAKYSPCGKYLALGSNDNRVYILDVEDDYSQYTAFVGHSYIKHVDWSADGKYLQSTCGAYELLYWSFEEKSQVKESRSLKDTEWHTQTCALGWSVRGMWESGMDGTDINACAGNPDLGVLVASDDNGYVQLLNYPTLTSTPPRAKFGGHAAFVTNVVFTHDNKHVISVGGGDLTVFQWRIV